jgi:hypothetical protein
MAAIAFDTLKAARRLKDVGVPEEQAEAQAELMAEAFVFNMDALVTRDYLEQCLDARFAAQDARFMAHMDARLVEQDVRLEARFSAQDTKFDKHDGRFDKQDQRFDRIEARLTDHGLQFADIRGELKLHRWMLAIIAASTVIPQLQKFFALIAS